jgi:hypothetical protein
MDGMTERPISAVTVDDWRVAIVLDPSLSPGFLANTVAVIAIGLGSARPGLAGGELADGTGRRYRVSANRPVPVLQADAAAIRALLLRALPPPDGAVVVPFPALARSLHAYADYAAIVPTRDLADERIDGLGLAGPPQWVRSLTGALKLLR